MKYIQFEKGGSLMLTVKGYIAFMLGVCFFGLSFVAVDRVECKEEIKIAMPIAGNNGWGEGMRVFKRRVEEITNNEIEVKIYYGTLGGSVKIIESVKSGVIEGGVLSAGPLSNFVPEVAILNLPWLFSSWDHSRLSIDGVLGKWVEGKVYEKGFKILGWYEFGARDLENKVRPIKNPEDVKGLKIRVMESPEFIALYKAYGAIPVPMAPGEIYTAIQQGVIDGLETGLGAAVTMKIYEVAKYGASLGEVLAQNPFGVNAKWFDSLSEDLQCAVVQAGLDSTLASRRRDERDRKWAIEVWEKEGGTVTYPDRKAFAEIGRTIYPQFYDKLGGRKMIDWIIKTGEGLSDGLKWSTD
jgi:tripartite ATP-independent transporter DctP family solute receptor